MDTGLIREAEGHLGISITRELRHGGQKYVALAEREGEPVVLKLVALAGPHAAEALERARREVGLLESVRHPNIVRVVAGIEALGGGVAWLEEALSGEDLVDQLGTRWEWSRVEVMAAELADGLAALHGGDRVVVHRDLSPANVRCVGSGGFVIMDPGYARHIGRTTLTGIWDPGTPGYLTPEHAAPGVHPGPASDVFQVGILAFQALTGELPFPIGSDLVGYAERVMTEQAPLVQTLVPDLRPDRAALVDRCLHRHAARRFLDGAELGAAVAELA